MDLRYMKCKQCNVMLSIHSNQIGMHFAKILFETGLLLFITKITIIFSFSSIHALCK